ncbi:HpcH/HpaI aldolase family protein [Roseomonas elaeocarpi]|uniref:HpcH/HpaI aldolase/citrate lyase family protein n=1 Tax=Roseomonas elaeocarpi TaxID=907779 RepID=A0ABV6JMJ3_9PROT
MAYAFQVDHAGRAGLPVPQLRRRLRQGEALVGSACYLGSPIVAELMAGIGLDFVYIDQQHGLTSYDTMLAMVRAFDHTATAPIVRVAANDASLIGQVLDAGADGVIVPMVNSRAEAERAVAACRYGPHGTRSYGPLRAAVTRGGSIRDADERVLCLAMVETAAGVEHVREIAATPGLDGIYIGQADLAVSLGLEPELRIQPGAHEQAIKTILAACQEAGIAAGISGDPAATRAAGFRIVTTGSDHGFVVSGMQALQARLRDQEKGRKA